MPEPKVAANTSPIQYLHQLGLLDLLPRFYESIVVPTLVCRELEVGRALGMDLPDPARLSWCLVETVRPGPFELSLGPGESCVLEWTHQRPGTIAIIDDGKARRIGTALGVKMTGTVGVLARARRVGEIASLSDVLDELANLGFRLSTELRRQILSPFGEDR